MEKEIKGTQDERIKELLSSTKVKASENLKYRIMHQIEAENALARKVIKSRKSREMSVPNIFSVLGIVYLLIAALAGGAYLYGGKEMVMSPTAIGSAALIIVTGSAYWIISYLDARLSIRNKQNPPK